MININELRQSLGAVTPEEVGELLDRLEAAEKDVAMKERIIDSLGSELNAVAKERDNLRAKIEAMEKQEPVAEIGQQYTLLFVGSGSMTELVKHHGIKIGTKLYALPGVQPAQSVPDGWKEGVEAAARLIDQKAELYAIRFGHDDMGMLSFGTGAHAEIKMDHYTGLLGLAYEVRAMLAAAPKAKP